MRLGRHCIFLFSLISLFHSFDLSGQNGLKDIASDKKIYIGNLISNEHLDNPENFRNGVANQHLVEEYNAVVLENYMKMAFILPSDIPEDIHNLSVSQLRAILKADKVESFLSNQDWISLYKRGHAMIWFNQAPAWLDRVGPSWTGQQVFSFSRKYILALGQICGDRIDEWDVINEAISDDAPDGQRIWRKNTWYRRANDGSITDWGEATYENYIKMLFVWAREAQPQARLHINDYAIETFNSSAASKNRFMRDKVKALKACGAPIDGVGFQSHIILSDLVNDQGEINQGFFDAVEQSIQDLAAAELEVVITELDIRICDQNRPESFQEVAYERYCNMALSQPNCHVALIWGLRDEDNWITLRDDGAFMGCQDAVIVEGDNYDRKDAYDGVAEAIRALPDRDTFSFAPLNEGDGASANCGGMGQLDPIVLSVVGPRAVEPGEQVTVSVEYIATEDQDLTLWFQLDSDPFTVFVSEKRDLSEGISTVEIPLNIPSTVPAGNLLYRYNAFITPDGGTVNNSISEFIQSRVSVLDENSQLIIETSGPGRVSPGQEVELDISYSAVSDQEIVAWFQLDQSPFTTFFEYRAPADIGRNTTKATLSIPVDVPIANDAYQYQTLLVPTGGGWPERISFFPQTDVDVVLPTSNRELEVDSHDIRLFPNPFIDNLTILSGASDVQDVVLIYAIDGQLVGQFKLHNNQSLDLSLLQTGIYTVHFMIDDIAYSERIVKF